MESFVAILVAFVVLVSSLVSANQFSRNCTLKQNDFNPDVLATLCDAEIFSLDLLIQFLEYNSGGDFDTSPYSLWTLLLLLGEAASERDQGRFRYALYQDEDFEGIRNTFNEAAGSLEIKTPSVEVTKWQGIFADSNQLVKENYTKLVNSSYNTGLKRLDFNKTQSAMKAINQDINTHTNHLLDNPITAEHLRDAKLLMSSTVYLKGRWRFLLDESSRNGNNTVNTPRKFKTIWMDNLQAIVTEFSLGNEGRLSMLTFQPTTNYVSLVRVVRNLRMIGLKSIFKHFANSSLHSNSTNIIVPKFKATINISLKNLLKQLGLFHEFPATFLDGISEDTNLRNIAHSAIITVSEDGIEAAAVNSATFGDRPSGCRDFNQKRYLYLIVDPLTNFIYFAGSLKDKIYPIMYPII